MDITEMFLYLDHQNSGKILKKDFQKSMKKLYF